MTDKPDYPNPAVDDLHEVAARLPALTKLRRDLAYRLPDGGRLLKNICLTREQVVEVLKLCEDQTKEG
jgi:hypothetical protein